MKKPTVKIKPMGEYILIHPIKEPDFVTPSGLIIQNTNKNERPQKGEVIALGTGRISESGDKIPFSVKVGDIIYFKKYTPEEVEIENEMYFMMKETDIFAIMNS